MERELARRNQQRTGLWKLARFLWKNNPLFSKHKYRLREPKRI